MSKVENVELVTTGALSVVPAESGYGSAISILPILALVPQIEPFKVAATNLEDQSTRAVIASEEAYQKGSEFLTVCQQNWQQLEDLRTAVKRPVDDYAKFIQAIFVPIQNRLAAAKQIVSTRMLAFYNAEQARQKAAAAAIAKANEEAALKLAAEAEEKGDTAQAQAIMEVAVMAPAPRPAMRLGGTNSFGKSTAPRKMWTAKVDKPMEVLQAIIDGKLPISLIDWSQSELNRKAKEVGVVTKTLGLDVYQTEALSQR